MSVVYEKFNSSDFAMELASWVALGSPMPTHYFMKSLIVAAYIKASKLDLFVETGTYTGRTTDFIARLGVEVHTIELSVKYHADAIKRFEGVTNVTCHQGDSGHVLASLTSLSRPAVFWLDGHYSGGDTALGDAYSPIEAELDAIAKRSNSDDVILIDDMMCFGSNGYPPVSDLITFGSRHFAGRPVVLRNDILSFAPQAVHDLVPNMIPELMGFYK